MLRSNPRLPRPPGATPLPDAITIREYRDADEPALIALLRELQAAELPHNENLKPPEDIGVWYVDRLRENCAAMSGVILMAVGGTGQQGCAVLYTAVDEHEDAEERPHRYALVSELVVTASARGTGVGKALLAECERRAKSAGRGEVFIAVYAANATAQRLYRDAGFTEVKIRLKKALS